MGTGSVEVGHDSAKYDDVTFSDVELSFITFKLLNHVFCKHPHT